jgi:predicted CXXCH cytochrome family protein
MEAIPPSGVHVTFACTECHELHEGTPQSSKQYGLKACTKSCHGKHDLGLSHPIGDDLQDKTGITLTCVTACHSMHLPNFGHLLLAEGSDVCKGCHIDKF